MRLFRPTTGALREITQLRPVSTQNGLPIQELPIRDTAPAIAWPADERGVSWFRPPIWHDHALQVSVEGLGYDEVLGLTLGW